MNIITIVLVVIVGGFCVALGLVNTFQQIRTKGQLAFWTAVVFSVVPIYLLLSALFKP